MSWLPPFSRGGAVRAASCAARSNASPSSVPRSARCGSGGSASGGTRSGSVAISSASRAFHRASRSCEGAVPIMPGWVMPVKRTPGRWREVAICPWKSQTALYASGKRSVRKPPPLDLAKMPV